jgi:hypothetical protein
MCIRQEVAMDSLKFDLGSPWPNLLRPADGPPLNSLMAVSVMACPQGGWPAAVFYSFGYSTPYAYDEKHKLRKTVARAIVL